MQHCRLKKTIHKEKVFGTLALDVSKSSDSNQTKLLPTQLQHRGLRQRSLTIQHAELCKRRLVAHVGSFQIHQVAPRYNVAAAVVDGEDGRALVVDGGDAAALPASIGGRQAAADVVADGGRRVQRPADGRQRLQSTADGGQPRQRVVPADVRPEAAAVDDGADGDVQPGAAGATWRHSLS